MGINSRSLHAPKHVWEVIIHHKYVPERFLNDIAMRKLDKPLKFSKTVKAVELATRRDELLSSEVSTAGCCGTRECNIDQPIRWNTKVFLLKDYCIDFSLEFYSNKLLCFGNYTGEWDEEFVSQRLQLSSQQEALTLCFNNSFSWLQS